MIRRMVPCLALLALLPLARAQQIEIKMATLAPASSPWYAVLARMGERWKANSGGKVKLTIFAGGVLGDEPDMVNKLRIRQVQAVALSGAGMSTTGWFRSRPCEAGDWVRVLPSSSTGSATTSWPKPSIETKLSAALTSSSIFSTRSAPSRAAL